MDIGELPCRTYSLCMTTRVIKSLSLIVLTFSFGKPGQKKDILLSALFTLQLDCSSVPFWVISVSFFSFLTLFSSGISNSGKPPCCLGAFPGPHDVLSVVLSQCLTFWWHVVVSSTKLTFTQGQGGTKLTLVPSTVLMPIFMYILPFLQRPVKCKYWRLTFLVEKRFLDFK